MRTLTRLLTRLDAMEARGDTLSMSKLGHKLTAIAGNALTANDGEMGSEAAWDRNEVQFEMGTLCGYRAQALAYRQLNGNGFIPSYERACELEALARAERCAVAICAVFRKDARKGGAL